MPWWIVGVVGLVSAGLLVLGALAVRAFAEVRGLARTLERAGSRLARAGAEVERTAEPLVRAAGELAVRPPSGRAQFTASQD